MPGRIVLPNITKKNSMEKKKINYKIIIRIFIWIIVFDNWISFAKYQLNILEEGLNNPYAFIDFRIVIISSLVMFLIMGLVPWLIYFMVVRIIRYIKSKKV